MAESPFIQVGGQSPKQGGHSPITALIGPANIHGGCAGNVQKWLPPVCPHEVKRSASSWPLPAKWRSVAPSGILPGLWRFGCAPFPGQIAAPIGGARAPAVCSHNYFPYSQWYYIRICSFWQEILMNLFTDYRRPGFTVAAGKTKRCWDKNRHGTACFLGMHPAGSRIS